VIAINNGLLFLDAQGFAAQETDVQANEDQLATLTVTKVDRLDLRNLCRRPADQLGAVKAQACTGEHAARQRNWRHEIAARWMAVGTKPGGRCFGGEQTIVPHRRRRFVGNGKRLIGRRCEPLHQFRRDRIVLDLAASNMRAVGG
jgi:hypothetical protein